MRAAKFAKRPHQVSSGQPPAGAECAANGQKSVQNKAPTKLAQILVLLFLFSDLGLMGQAWGLNGDNNNNKTSVTDAQQQAKQENNAQQLSVSSGDPKQSPPPPPPAGSKCLLTPPSAGQNFTDHLLKLQVRLFKLSEPGSPAGQGGALEVAPSNNSVRLLTPPHSRDPASLGLPDFTVPDSPPRLRIRSS